MYVCVISGTSCLVKSLLYVAFFFFAAGNFLPGQSSMLDATSSALFVILYKILLKTGVSLIFSCPTLEQSFRSLSLSLSFCSSCSHAKAAASLFPAKQWVTQKLRRRGRGGWVIRYGRGFWHALKFSCWPPPYAKFFGIFLLQLLFPVSRSFRSFVVVLLLWLVIAVFAGAAH